MLLMLRVETDLMSYYKRIRHLSQVRKRRERHFDKFIKWSSSQLLANSNFIVTRLLKCCKSNAARFRPTVLEALLANLKLSSALRKSKESPINCKI